MSILTTSQVRAALGALHDPPALGWQRLAALVAPPRLPTGGPARPAGEALRRALLEAVEALRPGPGATGARVARPYQLLALRYVEGLPAPEVQRRLGVGRSQYFRVQQQALGAVAALLEERWRRLRPFATAALVAPARDTGRARAGGALPAPLTSFVGRERELREGRRLLSQTRLLTLTGPGGVGKTRLALELASRMGGPSAVEGPDGEPDSVLFPDGVWLVTLAAVSDPERVLAAIAQVLGVRVAGDEPLLEALQEWLREKRALLLADNFEHLSAAAPLLPELLGSCPGVQVLVTSRAPLRVTGEQEYPVPPLALPAAVPAVAQGADVRRLEEVEAVRLFVARTRAVRPDFALTVENAGAVAALCRRLDGLPLALELAAARVRLLAPAALLARLAPATGGLELLVGGPPDGPARHRTLRAAIAWSHDLLAPADKAMFRCLAVFAGGWTLEAAEAVCAGASLPGSDCAPSAPLLVSPVLPGLERLVEAGLVPRPVGVPGPSESGRYGMLETVREFALEQLRASGAWEETRERHAVSCLALAEAAEAELWGERQGAWLDRLEREYANLEAALRFWVSRAASLLSVRLAGALYRFWHLRGRVPEGRKWLAAALALPATGVPAGYRAKALYGAAILAGAHRDHGAARTLLEQSAAEWRRAGDLAGLASALALLGLTAWGQGDPGARAIAEESVDLARRAGDRPTLAEALAHLGRAVAQSDPGAARALYNESLAVAREGGDRWWCSTALAAMAALELTAGANAAARRLLEASLEIKRELVDRRGEGNVLGVLGELDLREGDTRGAAARFGESLALCRESGVRQDLFRCLAGLAAVALATGRADRAARLLGAAAPLSRRLPTPADRTVPSANASPRTCAPAWARRRSAPPGRRGRRCPWGGRSTRRWRPARTSWPRRSRAAGTAARTPPHPSRGASSRSWASSRGASPTGRSPQS